MYKSTKILLGASVLALSSGAFANSNIQTSEDQQQYTGAYQVAVGAQTGPTVMKAKKTERSLQKGPSKGKARASDRSLQKGPSKGKAIMHNRRG